MVDELGPERTLGQLLDFRPHDASPAPARPLHPDVYAEDETSTPQRRHHPPSSRKHATLKTPVTFLCPHVPALGLFFASGPKVFQDGRLQLSNVADITALVKHPWFNVRIFKDTPAVRRQLAAEAALKHELDIAQRALADKMASKRKLMGPPGPFGPNPDTEYARFPARVRRSSRPLGEHG
jgi:hypothetical protein